MHKGRVCFKEGCRRRKCYTRIHTNLARGGGPLFDEVACDEHAAELASIAPDDVVHASSTAPLRRLPELDSWERQLIAGGEALWAIDGAGVDLEVRPTEDGRWAVWHWVCNTAQECIATRVHLVDAIVAAAEEIRKR